MIVIGVLAAIAIPVALNQRIAAYDAAAKSDLRNEAVRLAEFALGDEPASASDLVPTHPLRSPGVVVELEGYEHGAGYCLSAQHEGSPNTWYWNSRDAVMQRDSATCPWDGTERPHCNNGVNVGNTILCNPFPGKGDRQAG